MVSEKFQLGVKDHKNEYTITVSPTKVWKILERQDGTATVRRFIGEHIWELELEDNDDRIYPSVETARDAIQAFEESGIHYVKFTDKIQFQDGLMTVEKWGLREYNSGHQLGYTDAIQAAFDLIMKTAALDFTNGKDESAKSLRTLAQDIKRHLERTKIKN